MSRLVRVQSHSHSSPYTCPDSLQNLLYNRPQRFLSRIGQSHHQGGLLVGSLFEGCEILLGLLCTRAFGISLDRHETVVVSLVFGLLQLKLLTSSVDTLVRQRVVESLEWLNL